MSKFALGSARRAAPVLLFVFACATAGRGGARGAAENLDPDSFEPQGEIVYAGPTRRSSTAFDDRRVVGPSVSMTRNRDGSWSGWLQGRAVQLEMSGQRIDGAALSLVIEDRDDGGVEIRGHWLANRGSEQIYIRVTPDELFARGRTGTQSLFLKSRGPGIYGGTFYGDFSVELKGAASLPHLREPQFAFAVLGALSG